MNAPASAYTPEVVLAGEKIISADSHIQEPEDLWVNQLPAAMKERLFESMVSVRAERATHEPHLGLGLYIVRQIGEFHGGSATAADCPDGSGVIFELRFPISG